MSFKLDPAIRSRDTGQRIPCFGGCQLWVSINHTMEYPCSRQKTRAVPQSFTLAYMKGWTVVRSTGDQNQIFSRRWVTIFSYPWCSVLKILNGFSRQKQVKELAVQFTRETVISKWLVDLQCGCLLLVVCLLLTECVAFGSNSPHIRSRGLERMRNRVVILLSHWRKRFRSQRIYSIIVSICPAHR